MYLSFLVFFSCIFEAPSVLESNSCVPASRCSEHPRLPLLACHGPHREGRGLARFTSRADSNLSAEEKEKGLVEATQLYNGDNPSNDLQQVVNCDSSKEETYRSRRYWFIMVHPKNYRRFK